MDKDKLNKTYNFSLINKEDCFSDLTNNKFDLSQFSGWYDVPGRDRIFYKSNSETSVSNTDHSVTYKYNVDWFRSENFINKHDGLHVLFSGCSESEGVGDNIEHAWTNILYKKISKDIKCSGFFNLSRSGWGWSKIVANALIYFEKYGYPDVYFILLPNHQRMHFFSEKGIVDDYGVETGLMWQYKQFYPIAYSMSSAETTNKDSQDYIKVLEKEYNETFMFFITAWKLFNKICKDNNVKLVFGSWEEWDTKNINNLDMFDNFINIDNAKNLIEKYVNTYYETNQKTKYDLKKRDGHQGRLVHNFWAEEFYSSWKGLQK